MLKDKLSKEKTKQKKKNKQIQSIRYIICLHFLKITLVQDFLRYTR